ncbi:hypothetical protein [Saliphagus infecundisoli]|uniref:Uncharacterized protein n=1 Tax=Saliphagus infecundisoli TaxID=1849069 RepID=A0ABD5QAX1_9EURY|nr:hypothetical protein [Saliphagus infecundisoli]
MGSRLDQAKFVRTVVVTVGLGIPCTGLVLWPGDRSRFLQGALLIAL